MTLNVSLNAKKKKNFIGHIPNKYAPKLLYNIFDLTSRKLHTHLWFPHTTQMYGFPTNHKSSQLENSTQIYGFHTNHKPHKSMVSTQVTKFLGYILYIAFLVKRRTPLSHLLLSC